MKHPENRKNRRLMSVRMALCAGVLACIPLTNAAAESKHFAISWFAQATYTNDHDCSKGAHPPIEDVFMMYAAKMGKTPQQIAEWRKRLMEGEDVGELYGLMMNRGRINGQPVNPYTNPASVIDLNLPGLDGKEGFGFDLDGKGPDQPGSFTDPETKERGVDHNLYRALGCARAFRGSLENRPTFYAWSWGQLKDSQPAWLISVEGADLSKDGPVTISIDRAYEYLRSNSDGSPRFDMAYRVDPDPRSRNKYKGELHAGTVTITEHGKLRLLQNPLVRPEFDLTNVHLRLELKPDRSARGFIGGYTPWRPIYWGIAGIGFGGELMVTGDIPGVYHLLKRYADADPDPKTGQNESISATYYLEAVPAFVKPAEPNSQQLTKR